MALYKKIRQIDGIDTEYHRIVSVTNTVNSHVSIGVLSLPSKDIRELEKSGAGFLPYTASTTYETTDTDFMTLEQAYNYVKGLSDFSGAVDC